MSLVKPLRFCSKCQQEALAREQLLENKLAALQRLVGQTESASSDAWKSLIDEVSIFPDLGIALGGHEKSPTSESPKSPLNFRPNLT